jgi:L,D-peptidoglycan transpeptidase YkuD (ErfK/YbiS/YcfS/YnhG family)
MDIALESKHVIKPSNGWYSRVDAETGEVESTKFRLKDTDNSEFWIPVITKKSFQKYVNETYQVSHGKLITDDEIDAVYENLEETE